jgi:hypothetical protein
MDSQDLLRQVELTVGTLQRLWVQIGTADDKIVDTLERLRAAFLTVCQEAVMKHTSIRDELLQRIESHARAIQRLNSELGIAPSDTTNADVVALVKADDSPLLVQSEKLMLQLTNLQSVCPSLLAATVATTGKLTNDYVDHQPQPHPTDSC